MKKSTKKLKKPSPKKSKLSEKLRKMINDDVDRYISILGMKHYNVRVLYMASSANPQDDDYMTGGEVAAATEVDTRYLRATIKIFPFTYNGWRDKRMSDSDIHEIIAHEVCHIATPHMFQVATATYKDSGEMHDAWESTTTIMGRLVHKMDLYKRGILKPEK